MLNVLMKAKTRNILLDTALANLIKG